MDTLKNGTTTVLVHGEDYAPGQNALPSRPRGQKSTNADLVREASALALSERLEKMMSASQNTMAKRRREEAPGKGGLCSHLHQPHQESHKGAKA
jgi:hypothetical protein